MFYLILKRSFPGCFVICDIWGRSSIAKHLSNKNELFSFEKKTHKNVFDGFWGVFFTYKHQKSQEEIHTLMIKKSEYKILFFHWEIRFLKCALRCGRLVDLLRFYIVIDRNLDFFVKMSDNARNSSFNCDFSE